ncbi:hypothetical protein Poli38472_011548 [Pythium oligandrum]|uniref:Uncharacterized protein n=1 Tax=Pythium oligandrum TaxID=41045 RepID=A0A8K1CKJ5_PYTOL|nr:hypothetical protein Poli38472_011548 [Pythium oligandrum]|eukprot:TMW64668.1 hypothetical protein Poli38472_011548 [Pythium oligandrum]
MEPQDLHVRSDAKKRVDGDFFMQQVELVHECLKDQWTRQYRPAQPLHVPFAWVLSKMLRLLEEYPDGLTEAVILTELMTRLHQRERLTIKRARVPSIQELLNDNDDTVIEASIVDYAQHCLKLNVVDGVGLVRLFVHQRFRSCMMALAAILHHTPGLSAHFPFVPSRKVVLTNAKLMERRKDADAKEVQATLLPTPYLALLMDDTTDADRLMTQRAVGFREVDDMVRREQGQAESMLQQLIVRARVADIGAIRPCTTPYHIHRQVILLSDVTVSPNSAVMASHVWILWDDQVALSRLFHVGDIVTILYPFVHICAPDDPELVSVFDEYLSQQRGHYYLEYGSATTLFITRRTQVPALTSAVASNNMKLLQQEEDSSSLRVSNASKDWIGFAVYGSAASIRVSHGIPLLAAYFHAYYDAKTRTDASGTQRPTLDRAIISKYFLVVVLELYDSHSNEMLSVEVTGRNALKALQLRSGQTVQATLPSSRELDGFPDWGESLVGVLAPSNAYPPSRNLSDWQTADLSDLVPITSLIAGSYKDEPPPVATTVPPMQAYHRSWHALRVYLDEYEQRTKTRMVVQYTSNMKRRNDMLTSEQKQWQKPELLPEYVEYWQRLFHCTHSWDVKSKSAGKRKRTPRQQGDKCLFFFRAEVVKLLGRWLWWSERALLS